MSWQQRERHRAALRGIGEHAHRARQRGEHLLGPRDAVEVARHRPEAVVRRDRPSPKSSTCCSTGSGRRLANTSPGSSSTGSRLTCATAAAVTMLVAPGPIDVVQAIMRRRRERLGERDRRMRHRLLVVRAEGRQLSRACHSASPSAGDVAVAEDRPHAGEQRLRVCPRSRSLRRQVAHQRLRHREPDRHRVPRQASRRRGMRRRLPAAEQVWS